MGLKGKLGLIILGILIMSISPLIGEYLTDTFYLETSYYEQYLLLNSFIFLLIGFSVLLAGIVGLLLERNQFKESSQGENNINNNLKSG